MANAEDPNLAPCREEAVKGHMTGLAKGDDQLAQGPRYRGADERVAREHLDGFPDRCRRLGRGRRILLR